MKTIDRINIEYADYDDRVDVYEEIWKEAKANHETSGSWSKEYKKSAFVS